MSSTQTAASVWPWIPVVAAIIGVSLGYALSRIPARRDRKRKATGYLRGLSAELDFAIRHALIYQQGEAGERVLAPAYRLLTRFHIDGTAWLAGEGFLTRGDIEALLASLAAAEEFNRCLEEVHVQADRKRSLVDMRAAPKDAEYQVTAFLKESVAANRATVKAGNICRGDPPEGVAVTALAAIRAAADRAGFSLVDYR